MKRCTSARRPYQFMNINWIYLICLGLVTSEPQSHMKKYLNLFSLRNSFSKLFAVCRSMFAYAICIVHVHCTLYTSLITLISKTFPHSVCHWIHFWNICSRNAKGKDTPIPTIFYSFKRYQIKLISLESVPSKRGFHFIYY